MALGCRHAAPLTPPPLGDSLLASGLQASLPTTLKSKLGRKTCPFSLSGVAPLLRHSDICHDTLTYTLSHTVTHTHTHSHSHTVHAQPHSHTSSEKSQHVQDQCKFNPYWEKRPQENLTDAVDPRRCHPPHQAAVHLLTDTGEGFSARVCVTSVPFSEPRAHYSYFPKTKGQVLKK